ncbi:MAG: tetratricopeptide repeat protein [Acidobacteria bacterium]|nr:tetratricopeptide repeat protein [Acidobacteriota bacterium]
MPRRSSQKSTSPTRSGASRSGWHAALIVVAGCLVYANSLAGPFVFDDRLSVVENGAIRSLGGVFSHQAASALAGRPVVGLTFALNFGLDGLNVTGYHIVNIAIHLACALLLFDIARRTLMSPRLRERYGRGAPDLAFAIALLWTVHPLNTEGVSYLTQRTESLMALFYLLTLYASIRSQPSRHSAPWQTLAVLACGLGMGSKESMVTAPLIVVFYDRIFAFDSLRDAIKARWRLYGGLALTWIVLAYLILPGPRSGSAGFSTEVRPWTYLLNQAVMVARYLRLALWPSDLVLLYGSPVPLTLGEVLPQGLGIVALLLLTLAALRWMPAAGFLAAAVFIILAPASSIIPIATEVGAERRMYLPLMAILALLAAGLYGLDSIRHRVSRKAALAALAAVSVALGVTTIARNREYESGLSLAQATLRRWPTDVAHASVGVELVLLQRDDEAIPELQLGARTDPRARHNLGVALFNTKRFEEAVRELKILVSEYPMREEVPDARRIIGHASIELRKWSDAVGELRLALSMRPEDREARRLLVIALGSQGIEFAGTGNFQDAIAAFSRAVELDPNDAGARHNLATALLDGGDIPRALVEARQAVGLDPTDAGSYDLIGRALSLQGKFDEAIAQFDQALRLSPDDASIQDDRRRVLRASKNLRPDAGK